MNLYLRLIWLLIRLPFLKKQEDALAPSKLTMRVMLNDLDLNFHVNNGRYLTIMDLGRIHLIGVTGLYKYIRKNKWMPVLGSAKIHFLRSLGAFNKFTMTTQVIYWDEKWIYVEQKIFKKNELYVIALFKTLFVGKQGKVPADQWLESEKVRENPQQS
jgi:acyl-CoA thioesterase FadM